MPERAAPVNAAPRGPGGARARTGIQRVMIALFALLVVAPLAAVAFISTEEAFRPAKGFLEIEMQAIGGTRAQVFWASTGAFTEADSSTVRLHAGAGDFERLRFPLPARSLDYLRVDPLDGPGEVVVRGIRVVDPLGRTIRSVDPLALLPLYQIQRMAPDGPDVRVVTTPAADDPMLLLKGLWISDPPRWNSRQFVTSFSLAWIAIAAFAALATGIMLVTREVAAGPIALRHALWLAALFAIVLAAKLTLLRHYPMPVPFWDQWDAEAGGLFLPFSKGLLTWRQMFSLHNEHRIFFTRVLAVVLLALDGQWDPQLEIVVNIILHATTAVVLAVVLWLASGRRWIEWIVVTVALSVAPPFALENTLAGFQSQFYFFVLLSILTLWLMGTSRAGSAPWFVGWFLAFCTIVTVGGGVLVVPAVGCIVVLRTLDRPALWRQGLASIAALTVVAIVGYAAMSPPIAAHDFLRAGTFDAFRTAWVRGLAFPWVLRPWTWILLWSPLIFLGAGVLARRCRSGRLEQYLLGLGGWVVLQAAAVAYSRGANGAVPASRYLDTLALGLVANTIALVFLLARGLTAGAERHVDGACAPTYNGNSWRWVGWSALAVWLAGATLGTWHLSRVVVARDGHQKRQWMQAYVRNLRQAIVTDDLAFVLDRHGPEEIPYVNPSTMSRFLASPYIRGILPSSLRKPLPLVEKTGTASTFARTESMTDLLPTWDSFAVGGAPATGRFESGQVRCTRFQYLRFEIAGSPGSKGLELALREVQSGHETRVQPGWSTGTGWRTVHLRCPDGPFTVVAEDTSSTGSLGFRPPTEIAAASALAEAAIERSSAFGAGALTLVLLACGTSIRDGRPRRSPAAGAATSEAGAGSQ